MNKIYFHQSLCSKLGWIGVLLLVTIPWALRAQQGSNGNTSVLNAGEAVVFGAHTFAAGDPATTQPGIVRTDRSPISLFSFYTAASHSGSSDLSHVDGYVGKYGTTAFTFPVGQSGKLRPVGISGAAASSFFKAAYWLSNPNSGTLPVGAPFPIANLGADVDAVSNVEYWDVDGATTTNLTLSWDATSALAVLTGGAITRLVIVGYNSTTSKWENLGNAGGTTGTLAAAGTLTANDVTPDDYTAFTFGAINNPLPVKLVSFSAKRGEAKTSLLSWTTTEETNSDRFEIERSLNGEKWNKIGTVVANGESIISMHYYFSDNQPLGGENLYRLRMVDKDGTFTYSRVQSVSFESTTFFVYPNPVADFLSLGSDVDKYSNISIIDMTGEVIYAQSSFSLPLVINVKGFANGAYVVKATGLDGITHTKKVVFVH